MVRPKFRFRHFCESTKRDHVSIIFWLRKKYLEKQPFLFALGLFVMR